jgi:hypothetical protein
MTGNCVLALMVAAAAHAQIVPAAKKAETGKGVGILINTEGALRPGRQTLLTVEKLFDTRLFALGSANQPVEIAGLTRGIYLGNFGAVFSSEISLAPLVTTNPFRPTITKKLHDDVHQMKVDRLPALRATLIEMIKQAAQGLPQMPETQQIVVAVRLDYMSWEDRSGLPGQIMVAASRKDALAGVAQTTEEQ